MIADCYNEKCTPVLNAIRAGNVEDALVLLISRNVEVRLYDPDGWTPLMHAVNGGHVVLVKRLLEAGADPLVRNESNIPLLPTEIAALLLGHGEDLEKRVMLGSDVNKPNSAGRILLHNAVGEGNIAVSLGLSGSPTIDLDAKDLDGRTPLHLAVMGGHIDLTKHLLQAGASSDLQDAIGRTPLHYASYSNACEIIDLLIAADADVWKFDCYGRSVRDWMINNPLLRQEVQRLGGSQGPLSQKPHLVALRQKTLMSVQNLLDRVGNLSVADTAGSQIPIVARSLMFLGHPLDAITAFQQAICLSHLASNAIHVVADGFRGRGLFAKGVRIWIYVNGAENPIRTGLVHFPVAALGTTFLKSVDLGGQIGWWSRE
ncbi:MAG: hypothetical protein Q9227_000184 [Pyrenula ochraceoflavens]